MERIYIYILKIKDFVTKAAEKGTKEDTDWATKPYTYIRGYVYIDSCNKKKIFETVNEMLVKYYKPLGEIMEIEICLTNGHGIVLKPIGRTQLTSSNSSGDLNNDLIVCVELERKVRYNDCF